jgi:hypothetical protein
MKSHIAAFRGEPDYGSLEKDEAAAIQSYDYEKARFLAESCRDLRAANVQDARAHYERELERYNTVFSEILADKKARHRAAYEDAVSKATENLRSQILQLAEVQKQELQELEARWKNARRFQLRGVQKKVATLLSSSQLLAQSHRFEAAISMRDSARATEKRSRHPSIDAVDDDYTGQFKQTLERHKQEFAELIEQHKALKLLLSERRRVADEIAEAEDDVEAANASVEIMDTALRDRNNREVAVPVVRHFSPRGKIVQTMLALRNARRSGK